MSKRYPLGGSRPSVLITLSDLQGTNTLALAAREIVSHETGSRPEALKTLTCSFTGMVIPETSIRFQVVERDESGFGNAEPKLSTA